MSVGRLDVNTSGLLLLTNCGQLKQVRASACCAQSVEAVIFCSRR
jgi:hypothetical protein